MAIVRAKRNQNFTVINNNVYKKHHLSWQAMGMLGYLLSKPDDWQVVVPELVDTTRGTKKHTGRDGVYTILSELEEKGYLFRKKNHDGTVDCFIFDEPQEPNQAKPNQAKPNQAKPNQAKPNQAKPYVLINTERQQELKYKQELIVAPTAEAEDAPSQCLLELQNGNCLHDGGVLVLEADEVTPSEKSAKPKTPNPDNVKTWEAYRQAYLQRYGVEPIRNAQANGLIANLVKSVGSDEAPQLAWYYVWHNKGWYVKNRHALKHLIADVQAVRTDWLRNEQMTATMAQQSEKTQANLESHKGALDILRAKGVI